MRRSTLLAVAVVAPLGGCLLLPLRLFPPSLTSAGAAVRVVDAVDPQCQQVGPVEGGWTRPSGFAVLDDALRVTRNHAAELGADTLVVGPPQVIVTDEDTTDVYQGTAYRCWPDPIGAYLLARVTGEIAVRAGPDRLSPVRRTLAPGTLVDVADTVVNGFRRVHFRDEGGPTAFIAADAVELLR
ncbi:SH3 domain-containing protein [Anaeromyxobacter oryzae]|uniref:Lipoprotein n=1 Tax=Anaeromyxobacter oryzae TaxID=2918170 RepID=A0ABM7WUT0_9BACT|nr:SH3 domain-containing protein [Anaeromyxobacter oryzae]BDG03273.1 hypothetical protein AMOR_22690 [Anaeromyxobacter oryzae]